MQEFFGIHNFHLRNTNVADEKDYAELYRAFKNHPLPMEYLRSTYATRFARYFYSAEELESFLQKWAGADLVVQRR
jgi:hypothetical protein